MRRQGRLLLGTGLPGLLVLAALVLPAAALAGSGPISLRSFSVTPSSTQAGGHPDVSIAMSFCDKVSTSPDKYCTPDQYNFNTKMKDFTLRLPPGLVANPQATPRCSTATFLSDQVHGTAAPCSSSAIVGSVTVDTVVFSAGALLAPVSGSIYNLEPQSGDAASLGIRVDAGTGIDIIHMIISLRPASSGLGIEASASNLPGDLYLNGVPKNTVLRVVNMTLSLQGQVGSPAKPFITNPTSCAPSSASITADSWADSTFTSATAPYTVTGCAALPFAPSAGASSGGVGQTARNSSPAFGLSVQTPSGNAAVKRAQITLPDSLRPSIAALAAHSCKPSDAAAGSCPPAAKIGAVNVYTPLFSDPLSGPVYLTQDPGKLQLGLTAQLGGPASVTLSGVATFSGNRSVAVFDDLPDAPVDHFDLSLYGGRDGILVAVKDLCSQTQRADASFVGQNGLSSAQTIALTVTGCSPPKAQIRGGGVVVKRSGVAPVNVSCAAGPDCAGTLTLATTGGKSGSRSLDASKLGNSSFTIGGGTSETVNVQLTSQAKKALTKRKSVSVTATATLGQGQTATQRLTLKAPRKTHSKTHKKKHQKKHRKR